MTKLAAHLGGVGLVARVEHEHGDRPELAVEVEGPADGGLGTEPSVRETDDPATALSHDQAGGIKGRLAGDVEVEVVTAQGTSCRPDRDGPVPERRQGRRIIIAKRTEVGHQFAVGFVSGQMRAATPVDRA